MGRHIVESVRHIISKATKKDLALAWAMTLRLYSAHPRRKGHADAAALPQDEEDDFAEGLVRDLPEETSEEMTRSVHRVTKADKAKTRAKRLARKTSQTILGFARHPLPVTCLDCGFLALDDEEVTKADRIMLHCEGSAGLPCSPEELTNLNCTRSLWVDYDLTYLGGSAQGIFDELEQERRRCVGYLKYRPGFSPSEHRDLLLKRMDSKEKLKFAVLGGIVTLFFAWIAKHLGLRP